MRLSLSPNPVVMAAQLRRYDFASIDDVPDTTDLEFALTTGWWPVYDTWTYNTTYAAPSRYVITVPLNTSYQYGDKARLTQDGVTKYGYITYTGAAGVIEITTGSVDYTITSSAISNIFVSRVESPLGFPDWFNWTPTLGAQAGSWTGTAVLARFKLKRREMTIEQAITGTTATGPANYLTETLPIGAVKSYYIPMMCINDLANGATYLPGLISIVSGLTAKLYRQTLTAWTDGTLRTAQGTFSISV
jgi:hypothetical protein